MTEIRARAAAEQHPDFITVLVVDADIASNRPAALNRAVEASVGDVIGVFAASDEVHPRLVSFVDSRFTETAADVVQGGIQVMDFRSSWWSMRNVVESYFRFRSGLQLAARTHSMPLADSTVFITRNWMEWSGGWDETSRTADYELGVRMSAAGAQVVVAYSPDIVTREEGPRGKASLFARRTREDAGSLRALIQKDWLRLPRVRQRLAARYQLLEPLLHSTAALLIPLVIVAAILFHAPRPVILITLIPLAIATVTLIVEVVGVGEFGSLYHQKITLLDYARLVIGTIPFQVVLVAATVRAAIAALRARTPSQSTGGQARGREFSAGSSTAGAAR